jgi:hypothetical protein
VGRIDHELDRLDGASVKDNSALSPRPRQPHPPKQEAWEPPVPLADIPSVKPFPVEVLPRSLGAFIRDAAGALNCPLDFLGIPMLAIAGAAIGASRVVEIKYGFRERPCLYAAVVGPPGSTKSPALKTVAAPVYAEQSLRMANFQRLKIAYEEAGEGKASKPKPSTCYVSDITTEALGGMLRDNPRGVVLIRDELTAWMTGMDQYRARGRGSDRQFFLAAWAGEPVSVHRKNQDDGPVFVPHPFIAVVGGLPPDLLGRLRGEKAISDGFLDRLLFGFPELPPVRGETWEIVREEFTKAWRDTLSFLWELKQEPDDDGGLRPRVVRLGANARKSWEKFTRDLADQMNDPHFPDFLRGPWSKMKGYCARLTLILHFLRLANGEVRDEEVDEVDFAGACSLVSYFQAHARKVYCTIDADQEIEKAKKVLGWIERERRTEFKRWEPYQDMKNLGQFPKVEYLDEPLERLTKHNYIRLKQEPVRRSRGRQPASVFEVNLLYLQHLANRVNRAK